MKGGPYGDVVGVVARAATRLSGNEFAEELYPFSADLRVHH
jgi:hypothetical protein